MEEDHYVSSSEDDDDDEPIEAADEAIISYYFNMMINDGKSWPDKMFSQNPWICFRDVDANVYSQNPWICFNTRNPNYLMFVESRTEACGRTDGCGSGCWRIIGRDKLIKYEETGRFLGFKKILKFCEKEKKRSEERIWVMEEYRLFDKRKQDKVICKIRLLLPPRVSSLLAKHFSFLPKWIQPRSRRRFLPRWDLCVRIPTDEIISYYLKVLVDNLILSRDDDGERIKPADEVISYYLNMIISNGKYWPDHLVRDKDANVYDRNPWFCLNTQYPNYLMFVESRTEACGKTDGRASGCWRIIGRDKLIKSEETGKCLGFKKILKWIDRSEEADQRIWVMEEYRLVDKRKQDQVICKIRLLLPPRVSSLLAKHFSFLPKWIRPRWIRRLSPRWDRFDYRPRWGRVPKDEIVSYYLKMLVDNRNDWPSHFLPSEQVYGVVPWRLVCPLQSSCELQEGRFFFVNRTEICGKTDGCDGGCWRIMRHDKVITATNNMILGFKRVLKFCESDSGKLARPVFKFWEKEKYEENEFKVTWIMEEYRLAKNRMQGKVICRIRLLFLAQASIF